MHQLSRRRNKSMSVKNSPDEQPVSPSRNISSLPGGGISHGHITHQQILMLQRQVGNHAVINLLKQAAIHLPSSPHMTNTIQRNFGVVRGEGPNAKIIDEDSGLEYELGWRLRLNDEDRVHFDPPVNGNTVTTARVYKKGKIFRQKFVIEDGNGEVHFLPGASVGNYADETPVLFTMRDANYVNLLSDVQTTHQVAQQRPPGTPPVFKQISLKSCALEAARMMYASLTGDEMPPYSVFKEIMEADDTYDALTGSDIYSLHTAINAIFSEHGIQHTLSEAMRRPLSAVARLADPNRPVIAILNNPLHVVVIDRITGQYPNRIIYYRDSDVGSHVKDTETQFMKRATGAYYYLT